MPESLKNQFISDLYTSLLHLSGSELGAYGPLNKVFDGAGNSTGIALSGKRVIINNYIYPKGYETRPASEWIDAFFPVGCIQLTFDDNDPNTRIAGTTWGLVAEGKFLVGVGTFSDKNGDTFTFCPGGGPNSEDEEDSGNEAGSYRHGLTRNEMPPHSHITNVGSQSVQINSSVGAEEIIAAGAAGRVNSTLNFAEQQRARNILADKIRWNFNDNEYGTTGIWADNWEVPDAAPGKGEYLYPVKYGFDLNFLRGSAGANNDAQPGSPFLNNPNWGFVEMVGIWNGETRFIPQLAAGRRNIPPESPQYGLRDIEWVDVCRDLGCFTVAEKQAGELLNVEENNKVPLYTGDANLVESSVGARNNQTSSIAGVGARHNNIPPSYGVYVWRRLT